MGSWTLLGTTAPVVRGRGRRGWPSQTSETPIKRVKETYLTSKGMPQKSLQQEGGMTTLGFENASPVSEAEQQAGSPERAVGG